MSITVNDALQNNSPKSLDNKYLKNGVTTYATVADAVATIIAPYRSLGLTVLIGSQEYWWLAGLADNQLIVKNAFTTIPWGAITGTLANQTDLQTAFNQKENSILPGTVTQYWRGDKSWQTLTSDVVTEGSNNLYITTSRVRQSISAGSGIAYNNTTGVISSAFAAQVNSDWNAVSGVAQVLNKPTIPAAQVNSDWTAVSGVAQILNKPTIPAQFNPIAGSGISLTGSYPNITFVSTAAGSGTVTSIAVTAPAAFTVTGSPITTAGTIAITGAGTTLQYIRGDGTLATFPTLTSGTVTSVALTVPSGLTVTGSPITGAGTLAITTSLSGVVHAAAGAFTASNVNLATEVTGNLAVSHFNSGTAASSTTFWRGDGTWVTPTPTTPAGSAGYVQFNNTGAFGADVTFFWDNTNKRLGIGTSTPSSGLEIKGTGDLASARTGLQITSTDSTKYALANFVADQGFPGFQVGVAGSTVSGTTPGYAILYNNLNAGIIFGANGAEVLRLGATGTITSTNLAGSGTRMVVASASGVLSTQAIPSSGTGTVTSIALTVPSAFSVTGSPITTSGTLAITAVGTTSQYIRGDGTLATFSVGGTGTVTSVSASFTGTAVTISGSPVTGAGTIGFTWAGTSGQYVTGAGALATLPTIPAQFVPTAGSNVSLSGSYPNITFNAAGSVSSVALTMPAAFTVAGSPVTSAGTLAVTGAGTTSQYITGAGTLVTFPTIPAAQIQSDWNQVSGVALDFIKNKPTIPAAQVNSDWNATSGVAQILNKPSIGGTVTSVGLTMPVGFSVSGSPVTGSGTLAVSTTLSGPIRGTGSAFTTGSTNLASEVTGNLAVTHLNSGTGASTATFWRGDGTWSPTAASASGSYTPTVIGSTNVASITPQIAYYIQVGNIVTVTGTLTIRATTASTQTIVVLSVPVSTTFSSPLDLTGPATFQTSITGYLAGICFSDSISSAEISFGPPNTSTYTCYYTYTYFIAVEV